MSLSINLDFVKKVDDEWKEHVTFADGTKYYQALCPIIKGRCKEEECVFWNEEGKKCNYTSK